ncbi:MULTISPECIES: anti-sigma factor domain-containing protein [unclassified Jeotgalibaca]|uniref:anti-sigma factor domain-containing protein n=1 Tax=unclassified Jeotgalibaca TaxID=2621505 RepID=UPI003FD5454A
MYKKTVIAEIRQHYGLVIDEEGSLHRIKLKKGMRIGDRISYRDEKHYHLIDQNKRFTVPKWATTVLVASTLFIATGLAIFVDSIPEPTVAPPQAAAALEELPIQTADESYSVTIVVGEN